MSKDSLSKATDAIKKTVDNTADAIREGQHRSAADAERARRRAFGDEMKPSEKVSSVAKESIHRTQAEIDATKRKARSKT